MRADRAPARPRDTAQAVLPGLLIGLACGVVIGLLVLAGDVSPVRAAVAVLALGLPLAAAGAGYDLLLIKGRMGIGVFAPAAGYWLVLFPLSRLADEVLSDAVNARPVALPEGVLPFLAYQAVLSLGFAIGFVLLHENAAPRWWLRVRDGNPVAAELIERYKEHAAYQVAQGGRARAARRARKGRP